MKKLLLFLFIILSFVSIYSQNKEANSAENTTTYYLIRHSEKETSNPSDRNPNLSEIGIQRAKSWATILNEISFDAVYSTNYKRTLQTAAPIAKSKNLEPTLYDLSTFDFEEFKSATKGKTVFIVGHSNTTPNFANAFIGKEEYPQIKEDNYSNIYIITVTDDTVTHSLLTIN